MRRFSPNSSKRYRIEKRAWYLQIPVVVAVFIFDHKLWNQVSVLYLVIISVWSPAGTADGNETSAQIKEEREEHNE